MQDAAAHLVITIPPAGAAGPEAAGEYLRAMKWEILCEPLTARYRPTPEVLDECRAAGRMLAQRAREMAADRTVGGKLGSDP